MSVQNDDKILSLKRKIERQREEISNVKRSNPLTNYILTWRDMTYNLHVLTYEQLVILGWELTSLHNYLNDASIYDFKLSGYSVAAWIQDVKGKIQTLSLRKKEQELNNLEKKLNKLLSEDKKTEMELEEISNLLG